jgi:hypothetical protein
MAKFNAAEFTLAPVYPMDEVRSFGAVVNGVDPLSGWRKGPRYKPSVDIIHQAAKKITVTLVREGDGEFAVRTYWGADPKEILELAQGKREFSELSGSVEWSGGPTMMTVSQVFYYLANHCE